MLDESKHTSVYEMYMLENPKDKLPTLIDSLIGQFAKDMKKDGIKLENCLKDGYLDYDLFDRFQNKIKTKYYWHKIKAQQYAAIVSRFVALSDKAKGQRFSESGLEYEFNDYEYDDVAHFVSRKSLQECLDIMCHNTNVLEANNCIVNGSIGKDANLPHASKLIESMIPHVEKAFENHGIPKLARREWTCNEDVVEDYFAACGLYIKWAAYAKGFEGAICDSDYGPEKLKKVLDSVEYSADDVDLIVALNKALDVVHFRSDLAAAFIEGGKKTCAMVSNLPNRFVV